MKGLGGIILGFCLLPVALQAYLYDIKALRKWHPEYNRYHYFIGCCDFHDKTHVANPIQRKRIEELLPAYDPASVLVLVEDLSSPNDTGRLGCGSYFINSRVGILAGLGSYCKDCHIPFTNVEYRYCRVVALGPVINNLSADPSAFPSTKRMTVSHLMQEIEQTYNDLLFSSMTSSFKNQFMEISRTVNKSMENLNLMNNHQKSIAEYLASTTTPANRLEVVKNLLTFDGILIGFKLVDATIKASEKEKVIAFAGGTHITEAYDLLQKIDNWEPVSHSELSTIKASIARGIGANVVESKGKPQPISLELIDHYLNR
jgi:hypothetical protein